MEKKFTPISKELLFLMFKEILEITKRWTCQWSEKRTETNISQRKNFKYYLINIRASLIAQLVNNLPATQKTPVWFLGQKICWRRDRLSTPVFLGFPCGSAGKESACNVGDLGSIPGLEGSPGEGKGYPHQYSGLYHGLYSHEAVKSWTRLADFHFTISIQRKKN